jgi:carbonic anhydrase/acetyltransferase-like protein (isoleucine patch superfamily)
MAIIKNLNGVTPVIGKRAFLAETATIIGTVTMGDDCSIWYGAVLRGDVGAIRMGDRVNVQDNAVLHATYKKSECVIGNDVSIGHGANVHGAIIGNDVIIGMGAIVMDHTVVPDGTIIAAGAVVTANQVLEPGIYAGIPAKRIKEGSEAILAKAHANAENYLTYKKWYEE